MRLTTIAILFARAATRAMAAADILYSAYGVSVSYREPRKKVKGSPIVSSSASESSEIVVVGGRERSQMAIQRRLL